MGSVIRERENRVGEKENQLAGSRVPRDTWNPVGRRGDHPPSLNTTQWPIENKYCEGKVKSTPGGEWKRTWNPVPTSTESTSRCDQVPIVEWSGEYMCVARLSTEGVEPKGNQVWTGRQVTRIWPETGWPIHDQVEVGVKSHGGPNRPPLKCWRMNCG